MVYFFWLPLTSLAFRPLLGCMSGVAPSSSLTPTLRALLFAETWHRVHARGTWCTRTSRSRTRAAPPSLQQWWPSTSGLRCHITSRTCKTLKARVFDANFVLDALQTFEYVKSVTFYTLFSTLNVLTLIANVGCVFNGWVGLSWPNSLTQPIFGGTRFCPRSFLTSFTVIKSVI